MPRLGTSDAEEAINEDRVWELRISGKTVESIARELKISVVSVSGYLARVAERHREKAEAAVDHHRTVVARQLAWLYEEATVAWEKSKQATKQVTQRRVTEPGPDGSPPVVSEITTQQVVEQTGDPAYLSAAREALEDMRKLWGLDAPTKIAPTTPDGNAPYALPDDASRRDTLILLLERFGLPVQGIAAQGSVPGEIPLKQPETPGQILDQARTDPGAGRDDP